LLEDGIIDVEHCSAWVTENVLDAFFFQTFDNDFRAGIFHFKKILTKSTGHWSDAVLDRIAVGHRLFENEQPCGCGHVAKRWRSQPDYVGQVGHGLLNHKFSALARLSSNQQGYAVQLETKQGRTRA